MTDDDELVRVTKPTAVAFTTALCVGTALIAEYLLGGRTVALALGIAFGLLGFLAGLLGWELAIRLPPSRSLPPPQR
jgi:hypothetical protein